MPFTFSHPALIIPLLWARRRYPWVSATGLITGSIAPDFEKFIKLKLASGYSHTVASIFYFSCPVALGLAFLFHGLVRRPLLAHLPAALYLRLGKYGNFDWLKYWRLHYGGVLLSIVLGAALHLFWDLFTHPNTLITRLLAAGGYPSWDDQQAGSVLQVIGLVSTLVGGLAIVWAVWRLPMSPKKPVPPPPAVQRYWGIVAVVATALEVQWVLTVQPRLLEAGIAAITALMLGVITASLYSSRPIRTP